MKQVILLEKSDLDLMRGGDSISIFVGEKEVLISMFSRTRAKKEEVAEQLYKSSRKRKRLPLSKMTPKQRAKARYNRQYRLRKQKEAQSVLKKRVGAA